MIQLIYSSHATTPFTAESLRTLLVGARAHNTSVEVSGMLLHVDGAFLQVLEGEPGAVEALYERIAQDRRHARVTKLRVRDVEERNFPDWSMGFFDATQRAAALLGYRKTSGFADLLGDTAMLTKVVADFRDGRWRSLAA